MCLVAMFPAECMAGDVNLFFNDLDDSVAEIEIMIAGMYVMCMERCLSQSQKRKLVRLGMTMDAGQLHLTVNFKGSVILCCTF